MSMPKAPTSLPRRNGESGLAVVEVTILLPLMLLLFMGTAEIGRLIYTYNTLTKNAESGARYMSQNAFSGIVQIIQLTADKQNELKNMVVYGNINGSGAPIVDQLTTNDVSVSIASGEFLQVDISYTYRPMFGNTLSLFGLGNDIDLSIPLNTGVRMRAIN